MYPCSFWLYTKKEDLAALEATPSFQKLSSTLPVVIRFLEDIQGVDTEKKHHHLNFSLCHAAFIEEGRASNAAFSFLAPDVLYADGALVGIAMKGLQGNRVVGVAAQRLNRTSITEELRSRFMPGGSLKVFSPRELVRFASNHLHPATEVLRWGNPVGNAYPSLVWWNMGTNGHLIYIFHLQPIYIYPTHPEVPLTSTIDRDYLYEACPGIAPLVISDSDDYCAYELSNPEYMLPDMNCPPLCKAQIALLARTEASPEQLSSVRVPIRYHADQIDAEWLAIEQDAKKTFEEALSLIEAPIPRPKTLAPRSTALLFWIETEAECTHAMWNQLATWCPPDTEILIVRGYESSAASLARLPSHCKVIPGIFRSMSRELAQSALNQSNAAFFMFADRHTLSRRPRFIPALLSALECFPEAEAAFANRIGLEKSEFEMAHFIDRVLSGAEAYLDPLRVMLTLGRSDLSDVPFALSQALLKRSALEHCTWSYGVGCYGSLALLFSTILRSGAVSVPRGLVVGHEKVRRTSIFQLPHRSTSIDLCDILAPLDQLLTELPTSIAEGVLHRAIALLPQHIHVHALAPLTMKYQPLLPTLLVAGGIYPVAERLLRIFPESSEAHRLTVQALSYFQNVRACNPEYVAETEAIRALVSAGQIEAALQRLPPLLAFVTDVPEPLLVAALAYSCQRNYVEARRHLDKLCAIQPWRVEVLHAAAMLYAEMGDIRTAARVLLNLFGENNAHHEVRQSLEALSVQLRSTCASRSAMPFS
jgi:tetratricopeptide (TPR) repeat protein